MTVHLPTVAIIGSGFSGLTAAIQLKEKLGIKAKIFEWNSDIGGTWINNQYPGCACDIPSGLYSFSFELNPNWSTTYSSQPEILDYMRSVAKNRGIYGQTSLNTEVVEITWLESIKKWKLDYTLVGNDQISTEYFDFVFGGIGPLRIISIPDQYRGFQGTITHTGAWDHNIDFTDKRVAIIGNGASAVQAIPELQKVAKRLVSYQRSPTWVARRYQWKYYSGLKILFRWFPFLLRLQRVILYFIHEATFPVFKKSNSYIAKFVRWWFVRDMISRLEKKGRADLIPALVPRYPLGCKRIARSEIYLEALAESNVTVKMGNIKAIDGCSIIHEDGTSEVADILVLATGFDVQGFLGNLKVNGRNGRRLNDMWRKDYPSTYKGMTVEGFPNFFLLLGPNSALGVVIIIEIQVQWAIDCMKYMMRHDVVALEPKLEAQSSSVKKIRRELQGTAWASSECNSYYKKNGDVFALWSGTVTSYWMAMKFKPRDFNHYY